MNFVQNRCTKYNALLINVVTYQIGEWIERPLSMPGIMSRFPDWTLRIAKCYHELGLFSHLVVS